MLLPLKHIFIRCSYQGSFHRTCIFIANYIAITTSKKVLSLASQPYDLVQGSIANILFLSLGTRFDFTGTFFWDLSACFTSIFLPIGMGIERPRGIIIWGGGTTGRGIIIIMGCGGGGTPCGGRGTA